MSIDLVVKRLAENDRVLCGVSGERGLVMIVEPELNPIEEVKADPVGDAGSTRLIVGTEEDGGGKDSLKSLNDPPIVAAVLGQAEEVKDLSSALEADDTALLLDRKCGYQRTQRTMISPAKCLPRKSADRLLCI